MKLLPIAGGKFVKVDDNVFKWAQSYSWSLTKDTYAKAWSGKKKKFVYLHREIMEKELAGTNLWIDHINGDTFDYQRSNLRLCTNSQNQMNARKKSNSSSIYKGVFWVKKKKVWKVCIKKDGVDHFIGYFKNERHAAYSYDLNAPLLFGKFFRGNFTALPSDLA